jgi:hypothetical protein
MDLCEAPMNIHGFPIWVSGHVAEGQRAGERLRRRLELAGQDMGKTAFVSFDVRT